VLIARDEFLFCETETQEEKLARTPLFQATMSGTAGSQRDDAVLLNRPGVSRHGWFFSGKKCVARPLEAAQHWVPLLCASPAAWCLGRDAWDVLSPSLGQPTGFVRVRAAVNLAEPPSSRPVCACTDSLSDL